MYWWSTLKLAHDLQDGRVDEKERLKYYLATFVALNVVVYSGNTFSIEDLISTALSLIVVVIGTILCYRVNKSGDNTDFIPRMICLGWPVTIQITTAIVGPFLFLSSLHGLPSLPFGREAYLSTALEGLQRYWSLFWGVFFLCPYFGLIHRALTRIAEGKAAANVVETSSASRQHPKSQWRETAWDMVKVPLAILGGLGIPILFIVMNVYLGDPTIPERFKVLFAVWPAVFSWLAIWAMQWEKKRGTRELSPNRPVKERVR